MAGRRPGPASDLWSLGVVLYAATEGVSPFRRSNTPATLQSVLNAVPAPPAAAGPLAEVITGLLRKDPAHRPDAARVRTLLHAAAAPPAPAPTEAVRYAEGAGRSPRLGRRARIGLGAAVVAAAVTAYVLIAHPFAGPLPGGWTTHHEEDVAATVAVPGQYQRSGPDRKTDDGHWVTYTDRSGGIWVHLALVEKGDSDSGDIADSAAAEMYKDDAKFKQQGDYNLDMPSGARTTTDDNATFHGHKAAGNTITYTTDDSNDPRPREVRFFYYKTSRGDLYKLSIGYPGKGDFTDRGREVAKTAIANLDVDRL